MGAESIKNPLIDFAVSRDGRGGGGVSVANLVVMSNAFCLMLNV